MKANREFIWALVCLASFSFVAGAPESGAQAQEDTKRASPSVPAGTGVTARIGPAGTSVPRVIRFSGTLDHPLDPEHKILYHSFVESPDMKNIYDGVATLDENGEAWVQLPAYFEGLNRDFRYQLTAVGAPGPNLYVAEKVSGNRFKIAGGKAGAEVSWQVTGIRQDAFAQKHRIQVEEEKPAAEQGYYLHPDAYGQPEEKSVAWARAQQDRAKLNNPKEERETSADKNK